MPVPSRGYGDLDQVRIRDGIDACRSAFQELYDTDLRRAVLLLNDRRLTFSTLYIVSPRIEERVYPYLRERLVAAIRLIERVRGDGSAQGGRRRMDQAEHGALRWILDTGYAQDGLDETYEEVMERAVSLLINIYHDTAILPRVADMIFARYRKGRNIHDLTWAYFQSDHPDALRLIARRFSSDDSSDTKLARGLLHIDNDDLENGEYQSYLRWLRDNDPYLYFTGESLQYASAPAFYRVDPVRKYLQKGTASYRRKPVTPADEEERGRLEAFSELAEEEKNILAAHSQKVHTRDAAAWKRWMGRPVEEQLRAAKARGEGSI